MSMPALQWVLLCILFQSSLTQISFKETIANQQYYPRYEINLGSNPCALSVCITCVQIRCNNGVNLNSNQQYDNDYAWDYTGTTFEPPLTFVITKSNNDQIWFNNLISNYGTTRTYQTGQQFCPAPSPTQNTQSPIKSPTKSPIQSPTKSPIKSPTKSPSQAPSSNPSSTPTKNPTNTPTNNPSKNPSSNPTNTPTKNPNTASPTDTPSLNPTQSPNINPSSSPTNNPTKIPTASPSNKPTKKPSFNPTISPTRNDNGGAIDENESTQSIQDKNDNKSTGSANAGIFSDDNEPLIVILAVIIGSLGCCIFLLLMCYCCGKKKDNKVEKHMEMERIVSTSTIVRTGENKHTKVQTESMEINTIAIVDDNKMDLNRLMAMSIQSNVNNINVNFHNKQQNQQSMIILPPQPMVNNNMFDMSGEGTALKMWLLKCGVPQYYDTFVREGVQLATVVTFTDNDLQRIGIRKLAHRKVILNQIDIMKMDQNNNQYEGGVSSDPTDDLPEEYENDFDGRTAGGLNSESSSTDRDDNTIYNKKQETAGQ